MSKTVSVQLKRWVSGFLVFSLILSLFYVGGIEPVYAYELQNSSVKTNEIIDIEGHWAENIIKELVKTGMLKGYPDNTFRPNNPVTRAEIAAILNNLMQYQAKAENKFSDLGNKWYTEAMLGANASGIIVGSENKLRPEDNATREETAVMFSKALAIKGGGVSRFTDSEKISGWAVDTVNAMAERRYINGLPDGRFNPKANITRAEVAAIVSNAVKGFYSKAGTYIENVNGTTVVNTSGVILKDMTIKGDLILAEGIGSGDVTLDNVKIEGNTIVRGGGENSIIIKNSSKLGTVSVCRIDGKVSVKVQDSAEVELIIVDDGSDDVYIYGKVGNLQVDASDITVTAKAAALSNVEVNGKNATLVIDDKSSANTITFNKGASDATATINGTVKSLVSETEGLKVKGDGKLETAEIKGNDNRIEIVGAKVTAAAGVNGTLAGNKAVAPGTSEVVQKSSTGGNTSSEPSAPKPTPTPTPYLSSVTISGNNSVEQGSTLQLSVSGLLSNGEAANLTGAAIEWTIDNVNVATIDSNGLLTTVSTGAAIVTVVVILDGQTVSDTFDITVTESTPTLPQKPTGDLSRDNLWAFVDYIEQNGEESEAILAKAIEDAKSPIASPERNYARLLLKILNSEIKSAAGNASFETSPVVGNSWGVHTLGVGSSATVGVVTNSNLYKRSGNLSMVMKNAKGGGAHQMINGITQGVGAYRVYYYAPQSSAQATIQIVADIRNANGISIRTITSDPISVVDTSGRWLPLDIAFDIPDGAAKVLFVIKGFNLTDVDIYIDDVDVYSVADNAVLSTVSINENDTVKKGSMEKFSINGIMSNGEMADLTYADVNWSVISGADVAAIDKDTGWLTALSAGSAVVKAHVTLGSTSVEQTLTVTVVDPDTVPAGNLRITGMGAPEAIILVPEQEDDNIKYAANLLREYVEKSSSALLPIITDKELSANQTAYEDKVKIYVGYSPNEYTKVKAAGLGDDDAFVICPDMAGNSISILGKTSWGTRFGASEFLERYMDVVWLMPGEDGEDVPTLENILVPVDDVVSTPAFIMRAISPYVNTNDMLGYEWATRNRTHITISFHHNLFSLFPVSEYGVTHPEYYPIRNGKTNIPGPNVTIGWQPRFTDETAAVAAEKIKKYFKEHPETMSFSLGCNDNNGFSEEYATGKLNSVGEEDMSDAYYAWVNKIVSAVRLEYPDKWFGLLAYGNVMDPPSFALDDHVIPFITKDRMAWVDETVSAAGKAQVENWKTAAANIGWYDYMYGYSYAAPRMYSEQIAENFRYANINKASAHYVELYPNWGEGPKPWLITQLLWDPNQDVEVLKNEWYERAVGPEAAQDLKNYYDFWESFWKYRVKGSEWFETGKGRTFFTFTDAGYLNLITEAEIAQLRTWMESVVQKAGTDKQKARANMLFDMFEYYEASVLSYPKKIEPINNPNTALSLLSSDRMNNFIEKAALRDEIIDKLMQDPVMKFSNDPRNNGLRWTGLNPYEFWALVDYLKQEESAGEGTVLTQVKAMAQVSEDSLMKEYAKLLLTSKEGTDMVNYNTGFEDAILTDEQLLFNKWVPWISSEGQIVRDETNPRTGNASLKITDLMRGGPFQVIETKPGLTSVQAYYYTPAGTKTRASIQLSINLMNEKRVPLSSISGSAASIGETAGKWEQIGFIANIPEETKGEKVKFIQLVIVVDGLVDKVPLYIDDVYIYQNIVKLGKVNISGNNSIEKGSTSQLTVTGLMSNNEAADLTTGAAIEWSIDNQNVATIDSNGLLTAVDTGTATVTVTVTLDGKTVTNTFNITVTTQTLTPSLASVTISGENSADIGETSQLSVSGLMSNNEAVDLTTGAAIEWSIDNQNVATIDNNGLLTAVGTGTATVTVAVTLDGKEVSNTYAITVTPSMPIGELSKDNLWAYANYIQQNGKYKDTVLAKAETDANSTDFSKAGYAKLLLGIVIGSNRLTVLNPSFESGAASWGLLGNVAGVSKILGSTAFNHTDTGKYSLQLGKLNNGEGGVYQSIVAKPGVGAYRIYYYTPVGFEKDVTLKISVDFTRGTGGSLGQTITSEIKNVKATSGKWVPLDIAFEIPTAVNGTAVGGLIIKILAGNLVEDGVYLYVDDVELYNVAK